MPSDDSDITKNDMIETTNSTESTSLTISLDSNTEIAKAVAGNEVEKCSNLATTGNEISELVSTAVTAASSTTVLSPTSQILNTNDAIETLTHNVSCNFETQTTTTVALVEGVSPTEGGAFADGVYANNSTEESVQACAVPDQADASMSMHSDLPPWAARLKDCEMIGDSYRGYVNTEAELDALLSIHKEQTRSCWGTRQSPSSAKPSVRLMWKSQYVPYDGIPFVNSGRRATVMECQYGPRRKGNKVKVDSGDSEQPIKKIHRPTCPARIYIKKVCKFPEYRIDPNYEKTAGTRQAQERALAALRHAGGTTGGEERFYVQFPMEVAHEYHQDDDEVMTQPAVPAILPGQIAASSRLDFRVADKINELVARGVTGIYEVKHGVINFVEKELFSGTESEFPPRHNKTYFPTITDLQNHIHQAKLALEAGTLASLPPPDEPPKVPRRDERNRKRKRTEPRRVRTPNSAAAIEPMQTVCVQTNQLEMDGDENLQEIQASMQTTSAEEPMHQLEGQVFVMVPSSNNLFTTSDSAVVSLNSDKTSSLMQMQVVTVPTTASTYLGQQGDSSLGLTGQYLSLPVCSIAASSYNDTQEISASETVTAAARDPLGKDIVSLIPSSIEEPTIQQPSSDHAGDNHILTSSTAPISPRAIAMVTPDITTCERPSVSTIVDSIQPLTKPKEPMALETIDKNTTVEFLFDSGSQISKSDSEFSSANSDIINSIPCYTEESYNSSLDIIRTHEEITTSPSNFSGPSESQASEEKSEHETPNVERELTKV